jgi:hypothetical protein
MLVFKIQALHVAAMVQNGIFATNFMPNSAEMAKSSLALFEHGNAMITHYMFVKDIFSDTNGLTKSIFNQQYKNVVLGDSPCYVLVKPFNIISSTKDSHYYGNQRVHYVKKEHERLIYELLLK